MWEHEGSAKRKPQGPARWGRVKGMHVAAAAALWATRSVNDRGGAARWEQGVASPEVRASVRLPSSNEPGDRKPLALDTKDQGGP